MNAVVDYSWGCLEGETRLDPQTVGTKAAALSDLLAEGYGVARGFVIPPACFQKMLQQLSLPPLFTDFPHSQLHLNPQNALQLWEIAGILQRSLLALPLPLPWRVLLREALQQLAAGASEIDESFVYILRPSLIPDRFPGESPLSTTGILEARVGTIPYAAIQTGEVADFWADLRSFYSQCVQARSLLYWQHQGYSLHQVQVGVLVQPLIPALATGTIGLDPQEPGELRIEATWGLGFSIDRGEVLPDQYQVSRTGHSSWVEKRGRKPLLYWHGSQPCDYPISASPVSAFPRECSPLLTPNPPDPGVTSPPLRLHWIDPHHYTDPALRPEQLRVLITQALAYLHAHPGVKQLEWVLCAEDALPGILPPGITPTTPFLWIQQECSGDRWQNLSSSPEFTTSRSISRPDCPLVFTGEGAAGGYGVGQLYWLADLGQGGVESLPEPLILVGEQLSLDAIPLLCRTAGLVLTQGGLTSHGAILARELQIPAVVGLGQGIKAALSALSPGTWLGVDGDRGCVTVFDPPPLHLSLQRTGKVQQTIDGERDPVITATRVLTTVNQVATLKSLVNQTSEGIGLLRSEWLFLDLLEQQHPIEWIAQDRTAELRDRLRERLQDCLAAVSPQPVFYRSMDCRAPELQGLKGLDTPLPQPLYSQRAAHLTWRIGGTLTHCLDPRLLDLELDILHQVERLGSPLYWVLPMVRTVEEFIFCRDRLRQFAPFPSPSLSLWIMAEVPSILLLLPELVQAGVEGIAIGSGDLAQYLLGVDRDAGGFYGLEHPVVHQAILHLLQEAKKQGIRATLCSHSTLFPDGHLEAYIQAGLWGITAEFSHLPRLRTQVAQAERRLILGNRPFFVELIK